MPNAKTRTALHQIDRYGDPESHDLKHAISDLQGVPVENIILGEGIDGLLGNLCRLIIDQGDTVVTSAGAYPTFNYHVAGFGGVLETVPYLGDYEDPDALIKRAKETDAKLIYISNPDNPMGTHHSADRMQAMIDAVPKSSLLILDEAYIELAPDGTAPAFDVEDKNIIRFRTFSKAYGLAGARVGYGIAHRDLVTAFDKIRNHFGVSVLSQHAALAAVKDQGYLNDIKSAVAKGRQRIAEIAFDNGLTSISSAANFVAIDCGLDGAFAKAVVAELMDMGIFVRMPFVAPQDRCIRVSVGLPDEIERFGAALPAALKNAHANLGR